jgi:hypothetical protein
MLQVTISDQAGETLKTMNFKGEPLELCVASCKDDGKGPAGAKKPVSSCQQQFAAAAAAAALALALRGLCVPDCLATCFWAAWYIHPSTSTA